MNFNNADAVDVLRSSQKDEQFIDLYGHYLSDIIRLCGNKIHIIWLLLFIGGEKLFNVSIVHCQRRIKNNNQLTPKARVFLLKCVQFVINNKDLLVRLNQTAFYLNGRYYNISNRLTRIQYVFLRHWMGDDSSTKALTMLGRISSLYLICTLFQKVYESSYQQLSVENSEIQRDSSSTASDECFLCTDIKNYASILPCGHVFCWECIFKSISHTAKCPVCRETMQSNRIILLQNY